jgi:hypothetical protein
MLTHPGRKGSGVVMAFKRVRMDTATKLAERAHGDLNLGGPNRSSERPQEPPAST